MQFHGQMYIIGDSKYEKNEKEQQVESYQTVYRGGMGEIIEKKETAIKIALESKGNVRKRKIAVPLLMILGIVIIFSSIFLIINSPAILWYVYMVIGIVCLLLAFNAKSLIYYNRGMDTLVLPAGEAKRVEVYSVNGMLVMTQEKCTSVGLSALPVGYYMARAYMEDGRVQVCKIMK